MCVLSVEKVTKYEKMFQNGANVSRHLVALISGSAEPTLCTQRLRRRDDYFRRIMEWLEFQIASVASR